MKEIVDSPGKVSPKPSLQIRLAALTLGLILSVGLLEIALRVAPQLVPVKVLLHFSAEIRQDIASGRFLTHDNVRSVPRDDGGPILWILKPNGSKPYNFDDAGAVKLVPYDDMGFCNTPGRYKSETNFDIVTVGDSFTGCHAVLPEDTWSLLLENLLDTSAYNLGIGGLGLYEYVQLLKTFGLARHPKLVVMNVYEGNDLRDALRFHEAREGTVTELDEATQSQDDSAPWKSMWLGRHSYAFNFVFALGARLSDLFGRFSDERGVNFHYELVFPDRRVVMNPANSDAIEIVNGRKLETGEVSLDVFDEALQQFVDLSKEHGFKAIVTYSPSAQNAYSEYVEYDDPSIAQPLESLAERQREYFERKSRELGYVFLDLTPALREAAAVQTEELLYFPTTLHYTQRGHDVVARAIADLIADLGLAKLTSADTYASASAP